MINGYITPRGSNKRKGNLKLVAGAIVFTSLASLGILFNNDKKQIEREAIQYASPMEILDTDKSGKLSTEETERFYQVMGLDSKKISLDEITREQWNSFLIKEK